MVQLDRERVRRTIDDALAGPGGIGLVLNVFAGVPGVTHSAARRGVFRSRPARLQIGEWRYETTADARLQAAHVVGGIVIGEEVLAFDAVAPHLARALGQLVSAHGVTVLPHIDAAVEALSAASR